MKRGPVIHGVLLLVALLFAYQSWTREEKVTPKTGTVKVWTIPVDSISAITYDMPKKSLRLEKRSDPSGSYWWGQEDRTVTKKVKKPALPPTPDGKAPEPVEEEETVHDEFAAGVRVDELVEHMANLRALRLIENLSEEKKVEYGLDKSSANIAVTYAGGVKTLVIGGKVFGTRDRFVTEVESGKAYAISGDIVGNILQGQSGLNIRKYHAYKDDEVAKVTVRTGAKTHELTRITVDAEGKSGAKTKTWARAETPDKPDTTMFNFLDRVGNLRGLSYQQDVTTEGMTEVFRIDYKDAAGATLGWFEMYEKPPAPEPEEPAEPSADATDAAGKDAAGKDAAGKDAAGKDAAGKDAAGKDAAKKPKKPKKSAYYLRTERTRLFMLLSAASATRVVQDVESILAGKQPSKPERPE